MRVGQIIVATAAVLAIGWIGQGCSSTKSATPPRSTAPRASQRAAPITLPALATTKPANYPGLHNVVAYARDVLSGSVPEGAEGFETLQRMGVRTIISVDGAEPDLAAAKAAGLRYVHLPVTYAGFSDQRKLELSRALRDLPRPIYVHCHHGKHRSAGAAGAAMVTLGELSTEQAIARMKVSGTSLEYKGLYSCAESSAKALPSVLDAVSNEFPEISRPHGTVKSMVEIDVAMENLKSIQIAGWKPPTSSPDLSPAAEAGRIADLLRFLEKDVYTRKQPANYARLLADSNRVVTELETLLQQPHRPAAELDAKLKSVQHSCKTCHSAFRD